MRTRDEDWHRFIEGLPPDPANKLGHAWVLFEGCVGLDSAKAVHDAIAREDEATVRRLLMVAVASRRGSSLAPDQRADWFSLDATPPDILGLADF